MNMQPDFTILHSCGAAGRQPDGTFYLPTAPETARWGRLPDGGSTPVLSMPSGGTLVVDAVSHEGLLEDQGRNPARFFSENGVPDGAILPEAVDIARSVRHSPDEDGPHLVAGPVFVEGAEPGDILKVEVLSLSPRVPYAVSACRSDKGVLAGEFPKPGAAHSKLVPLAETEQGPRAVFEASGAQVEIPIRPFFGILGTAGADARNPHSVPPTAAGGNIDIAEFSAGAAVYFPVHVRGALFYAGDPHFAQGNGEVSLTALEGSLRGTFHLSVIKDAAGILPGAAGSGTFFGETASHWIFAGLDESLDGALQNAVRAALRFVSGQFSIPENDAYLYLGAAVDFSVSQAVDRTKGIHAAVAKAHFLRLLTFCLRVERAPDDGERRMAPPEPPQAVSVRTDGTTVFIKAAALLELLEKSGAAPRGSIPAGDWIPLSGLSDAIGLPVVWATEGRRAVGTIYSVQKK
ncbi:MAG: acetamidase/formamidase family protein [Treponemataceae bacterium]|nr:acetamidase/formamidase family protein [Treponemataceae bacterium]